LDPLNQHSLPPAPPLPEDRGLVLPSAEAPSSPSLETSYVPAQFQYISIPNLTLYQVDFMTLSNKGNNSTLSPRERKEAQLSTNEGHFTLWPKVRW